jgi:hypothetical protein
MTESEAKWTEQIGEWRASGKTAEQFASERQWRVSSLRYWDRRLRQAQKRAEGSPGSVRMMRVTARAAAGGELCVRIGAAELVVAAGFDALLLRQVVDALGGGQ